MKKITLLLLCLTLTLLPCITAYASLGEGVALMTKETKMIKSGLAGQKMTFCDVDFKTAMNVSDFKSVTITSLPPSSAGTLMYGGRRVSEGQTIKRKSISALSFIPAGTEPTECKFTFTSEGLMGGAEMDFVLKLIDKVNYAPEHDFDEDESASLWSQEAVTVYGTLAASDPEGDALEFMVISYPKNGTLSLTDKASGGYAYTPLEGFTGKDRFVYVVRDCYGNFTVPAAVEIEVEKRMTAVTYKDMEAHPAANAALVMEAKGIMSGTRIGDDMYFSPELGVTRAEFVAMAMKAHGLRADSTLSETYFDDNDSIPSSLRGYVATAARLGIVRGSFDGEGLLFRPNDNVTRSEAALIMSKITGKSGGGEIPTLADGEVLPLWARPAVQAMYECGIYLESDGAYEHTASVTRAEAADYLLRMMQSK
ncbi:MAG: S-layer homology domain-containing protein [Clostridia bacterium]|nr:S-layer homology domain-containing protein [Clostridia bacterium]